MPLDAIPSPSHIQAQSTWAKPKALLRKANSKTTQDPTQAFSTNWAHPKFVDLKRKEEVLFRKSHLPFRLNPFEVKTCSFVQAMSIHFPVTTICSQIRVFQVSAPPFYTDYNTYTEHICIGEQVEIT